MNNYNIIFINWKWRDFKTKKIVEDEVISDTLFIDDEYIRAYNLLAIDDKLFSKYEKVFYDDFEVYENDDREKKLVAKVVRTNIKTGVETNVLLYRLIEMYKKNTTGKLLLFLHRGFENHYKKANINTILDLDHKKKYIDKCFLFGAGRDFIYYSTKEEGLLDRSSFYSNRGKKIFVADKKNGIVYKKHFDKVWDYYEHEFKLKFFELEEELSTFFFTLIYTKNKLTWKLKEIKEVLVSYEALNLRIKSFLETPNINNTLKVYEGTHQKSFVFDDCTANLKGDSSKAYDTLKSYVKKNFLPENNDLNNEVNLKEELKNISDGFSKLLVELSGPIYP